MSKTTISEFFKEDYMPVCYPCPMPMKATFVCLMQPTCNNGQVYYCGGCIDFHPHKPVVISKKVQEITQIYDNFFEEVRQARQNAESKIVQYRDLIDYCDKKRHQNSTIDLNQ